MIDMLETSSAWLDTKREQFMLRSVLYVRGDLSVQLPATIGRTVFHLVDDTGATIHIETRDYLTRAVHLVLDGETTLPQVGDQVHELGSDGVIYIYEVLSPGNEPHFRFSDAYRKSLRIHTKQIDQEVA